MRIWREANGQSLQSTVRTLWPELADALDGKTPAGEATVAEEQPVCRNCGESSGKLAVGRAGGIPLCGLCMGLAEFAAMTKTRVAGWVAGRRR